MTLGLAPSAMAWERGDVLDAIHQVENPNNSLQIGRRGELGPYQIRPVVWNTYSQKPFSLASDQAEALLVAELHFEWIKRGLVRNKLEVTPYHIGLVWNAGLHATINGRASNTSKYYAERVANLVESKQAPRPDETAVTTAAELPEPPQAERSEGLRRRR
ncbi:MAG: hypothetical protein IPP19_08315 [Verrucomicrobia bacterium]|nr:hypothetical protein [Verrucomicrobiota bacterium]